MGKALQIGVWICVVLVGLFCTANMLTFGSPIPLARIDHLSNPAEVVFWNETGLFLEDGRHLMPAGMRKLPKQSQVLKVATRRGIEVAKDGRVLGLVDLWHWCGNDAVRYDLRKIDLAQLLAYHQEGESDLKPRRFASARFGNYRGHDWDTSGYTRMKMVFDPKFAQP